MAPALAPLLLLWATAAPLPPAPFALPSNAGDWPAWRGPARDNLSRETGLLTAWPTEGPTLLWKSTGLGKGFSTPSVAGGSVGSRQK